MQIFIKILLTIFLVYVTYRIWEVDIDVTKFRPDKFFKSKTEELISQIPQREKNAIYQNDSIVARVKNLSFREESNGMYFDQLEYSNSLNIEKEFEFQKYILKIIKIENLINMSSSESHKGRILQQVYCSVIRKR
ncbi:MAG: hypothetical protein COV71_03540 [Candidatus Omnitrophica bacterium CG11_big_fil_rev_8_21_14_0_20_41_12]|nr:MAG: hypothetical protein COV71_03540 [Candidatus Omnitrophica bacterium CG11_big_fil_rev_8_21_14_0_20_41_12]